MWISKHKLERIESELSSLRCHVNALESYMFVRADGHDSYPYNRTWGNSVSLREIVYALAKQAGLQIRVLDGSAATIHLIPAVGKSGG